MAFAASIATALAAAAFSAGGGGEIVVTRESGMLPSGCTPREAAALLVRFTEAFNRGDGKGLERVFAAEDGDHAVWRNAPFFRWYSDGRATVYDVKDLGPYFERRHRRNERLELVAVRVGPSNVGGAAAIVYTIRREADDVTGGLRTGKGELDCAAQRIFVWSMGAAQGVQPGAGCPVPEGWAGTPIVACSLVQEEPYAHSGRTTRPLLPDFRVVPGARLPARCGPKAVRAKLRAALSALNSGRGPAFAGHFGSPAVFRPYGADRSGRAAIARFAREGHAAGHGWTGRALVVPRRRPDPRVAAYRLDLLVTRSGSPLRPGAAKLVVGCSSGLFLRWAGPSTGGL